MNATVDKFRLRPFFRFNVECLGTQWVTKKNVWEVQLRDLLTGKEFTRSAAIFVSAVGGISEPRKINFPGMNTFKGEIFHTARWNHSFDYTNKRMAVIGNGCSAAQVVPAVQKGVKSLTQYARSAQWYHERPNRDFTVFEKFCFRYVPLLQRWLRLRIFLESDELVVTYGSSKVSQKTRKTIEAGARKYILGMAPQKYHDFIVPEFPLGCKRRIFDPNYLESLNASNINLVPEGIQRFDETGIVSESGKHEDFDVVVLATGFQVTEFLTPMEIVGKRGRSLSAQWKDGLGAQAYLGTYVHNFPNFGIIFGPNTFPAHNSVIYVSEIQVGYIAKTLFAPIIDHAATTIEVKESAEKNFVTNVDAKLAGSVFEAGCSNWYINSAGRNSASWPGKAANYWRATLFPHWSDFNFNGGEWTWFIRRSWRLIRDLISSTRIMWPLFLVGFVVMKKNQVFPASTPIYDLMGSVRRIVPWMGGLKG